MTRFEEARLGFHAALVALSDFIRVDRVLSAQVAAGRAEFFGQLPPSASDPAGAQRFLEWFALERRAEGAGGPPVVSFLTAGCPGLDPAQRPFAASLAESRIGVFAVCDMDDEGIEVEDAVGGDHLRVWLPATERRSETGNTLVGRLVPVPGREDWMATDSAEMHGGTVLYQAYFEEAERRRLESGEEPPPISQLEIERLLHAGEGGSDEDVSTVEREFATFLASAAGGLPDVETLSYALSVASRPGAVIGPFLEQVAFDTTLDLERAQRLCLRLWNAHRRQAEETALPQPPKSVVRARAPQEELGRAVLRELEDGMARGDDLEGIFDRLEQMVGSEPTEDVPEELQWHVEDEGNLQALLAEYLWEREHEGRPVGKADAERLQEFVRDAGASGLREVERLEQMHVGAALVEAWAAGRQADCVALVAALADWADWLGGVQELAMRFDPRAFLLTLREERRRSESVRRQLLVSDGAADSLRSWRVRERTAADRWVLASGDGREILLDAALDLQPGDLVLGRASNGGFAKDCRVVPSCLAASLAGE